MPKRNPFTQDDLTDVRHFLPALVAGKESTTSIARKTGVSGGLVWLIVQRDGYRYIRPDGPKRKGRWVGPSITPQENGTMTQQAVEDWAMSATDYEALLTTQAHEPEPQASNGHIIEAEPEDEMVTALEEARAAVEQAAQTISTLREQRTTILDDWKNEATTLQIALDASRVEAESFRLDALRWRDRHYQDTLHKRQMSVGLLRKGTDELRKLLSGIPNDAA